MVAIISKPVFKTFVPFGDLIAVKVYQDSETGGGLALPFGSPDPFKTVTAVVVAAGPLCKQVKEGDVILVNAQVAACKVYHGGSGEVVVLPEKNIFGVALPDPAPTPEN